MTDASPSFDRWLHGLKNQLSVILGFSEILLKELESGDARRRDLQEIHAAAERALDAMSRAPRPQGDGPSPANRGIEMVSQAPLRVLLADDQPGIRRLVRRCLADPRFQLIEAASGEEALEQAGNADELDLLITDEIMPGIHGHELARRMRLLNADLKVLYLTGYPDRSFDAKASRWEREAYLDKPFTPTALLEAIALLAPGARPEVRAVD